ncbi:MAG: lytic murein transglycosylase [Deltaproteobacteria bacterium]|jgi:membrane-bound lytic murein transglycosylase B
MERITYKFLKYFLIHSAGFCQRALETCLLKTALLALLVVAVLLALNPKSSMCAEEQAHVAQWVAGFKKEALRQGISHRILDQAFVDFEPIARVIELDRNQPEFKLSLEKYLNRVVRKSRVEKGRDMLRRHRSLLGEVYQRYGVQPRFLVALWGIESAFGVMTGKFPVIHAIATLAYNGRRSAYFRKELIQALRIAEEGHMSLAKMRGSWAGAMGQLQFMPSAFNDFGADFSGDGRIDIWNDLGDAFASAANYLSRSGWATDYTWGREVTLPPSFDRAMIGLETWKRLSEWQSLGVRRVNGKDLPKKPDLSGSILQPDGEEGRAYVVYGNFRVFLAWNKSNYFGIAVGTLADHIVGR